jgi:hypothetical protein
MGDIFLRYILGLMLGIILGLIFPAFASWWLLLIFLGVFIVSEVVGEWGFGGHWSCYRFSSYILYAGPATFVLFGILLGSGKIGALLIEIGTLISR